MRPIDADALKEKLTEIFESDPYPENEYMDGWTFAAFSRDELKPIIDDAPTIEAEPIVRCENCKYWVCIEHEGVQHTACKLSENPRVPEYLYHPSSKDFCSRAERKDEVEE